MREHNDQTMDRGVSWIILLASTFNFTLYAGIFRTFGVLYAELLQQYGEGSGKTAFVTSLMIFISAISGMFSGLTSIHFSFKWTAVVGGILAAVGMTFSTFVLHSELLYVTYSIILGSGLGIVQTPTVTIVNFYFDKKRGLANGVVASGVGISNLIFPVMYRKLFDTFGINGAVIILGGILLNICVAGSFYRQPKQFLKNQNSDKKLENQFSSQVEACNECFLKCTKIRVQILTIFKVYKNALTNKSLLLYFISFSLALVGSSGYFLILPPFLESRHFAKGDAVLVLTVYGATDLICRYIVGLVLDYRWITVHTFYTVSMVIGGTLGIVMIFVNSLALHFVIAVIFATFPGALFQCRPLMVVEVGQLADLPSVFALIGLLSNTAVLIGFPVLGWLDDWTGTWHSSIYLASGMMFAAGACVVIERLVKTRKDNFEKCNMHESFEETDRD